MWTVVTIVGLLLVLSTESSGGRKILRRIAMDEELIKVLAEIAQDKGGTYDWQ